MTRKVLAVRLNPATNAYEARCPDCGELAFQLVEELQVLLQVKVPLLTAHFCTVIPCTCTTDPYNCPQGQALAQAIHDRKKAQGDDRVRSI